MEKPRKNEIEKKNSFSPQNLEFPSCMSVCLQHKATLEEKSRKQEKKRNIFKNKKKSALL